MVSEEVVCQSGGCVQLDMVLRKKQIACIMWLITTELFCFRENYIPFVDRMKDRHVFLSVLHPAM